MYNNNIMSKDTPTISIHSTKYIVIEENEYTRLVNENNEMKIKISTLYETIIQTEEIKKQHEQTIDELRKENNELKLKIKELIDRLDILEKENKEIKEENRIIKEENRIIKEENRIIKEENKIIKEDNKEIHKQLTKIMNKTIFNKYTKAIQDVNRLEQFEKHLNNPKYMIQLREDRVDECHYINDNDTSDEQKKKMNILYEKINNMSNEVKKMFNRRYPNLINNISSMIPYDNTIIMTQNEKDDINEWCDE